MSSLSVVAADNINCGGVPVAGKKGDASLDSFYPVLHHHPQMQQVETYAQARQPPIPPAGCCSCCMAAVSFGRLSIVLEDSCCNVLLCLLELLLALDCSWIVRPVMTGL